MSKYNEIIQKASHNSFVNPYGESLDAVLNYIQAIEIDFYDSKHILGGSSAKHWFVRHNLGWPFFGSGNDNVFGGGDLSEILSQVETWCAGNQGHLPLTVFLDKKEGWGDERSPADLDELIRRRISTERLFTPFDLQYAYPDLRTAAANGAWLPSEELRDRCLFVLTGGALLAPNATLHEYVEQRGRGAALFVAPQVSREEHVTKIPSHFDPRSAKSVVFYNFEAGTERIAELIHQIGCVSRVFGLDDAKSFARMAEAGVNFIAVDHYH